ncbi:DUF4779 domain-containing protein [Kordia zhangzhouensis]|uniref:DUF4779 domain-containing protein n=1 Tax=Kordia zhangzhouensis TaxID=1620405 RepID=UPI0006298B25|nr:DUF4779 domain-containing protein [Kordia zhangzhouensis]
MYTFSNRLRLFAIISFVLGAIMVGLSFADVPGSVEDMKAMEAAHGHGHDSGHGEATHDDGKTAHHDEHKTHAAHADKEHHGDAHGADVGHHDSAKHDEHKLAQLQNKPWAAVYVAAFFFMMISLGVLAFYAIQRAAQAGWSPVLFRVMEGITAYIIPGTIIIILLIIASVMHWNHLFHWMEPSLLDPTSENYDKLTVGKSGWLNGTFFIIRAVVYSGIWIAYRQISRRLSLKQDEASDNSNFKKNFRAAAVFLVLFLISESMMSWDWIMSFDHHWFSTLFGWYVFASMFVSGITVIALVTIYLKSKGLLEYVNNSHLHDLAKFMFGISIFWTYLWFSQFMLIWYSNIPEEVTYFITRIEDYNLPFFGMLALNLIFPLLILMNSDFKRLNWIIVIAGIVILFGHYIDVFNMVMPATVGPNWSLGMAEIGAILLFLGLFIFVVFTTLTKAPLLAKRNPFIEESKQFHY